MLDRFGAVSLDVQLLAIRGMCRQHEFHRRMSVALYERLGRAYRISESLFGMNLDQLVHYFGKTCAVLCNLGSSPGAVGASAVISAIAVMP